MSTAKSVKPLPGYIVIEEIKPETKTASGLVLPDTAQEKPQIGKVIAISPVMPIESNDALILADEEDGITWTGQLGHIKSGAIVAFQKYTGHPIKIEGKEYQIVGYNKLLAIIE